jgi:hypothetical protein
MSFVRDHVEPAVQTAMKSLVSNVRRELTLLVASMEINKALEAVNEIVMNEAGEEAIYLPLPEEIFKSSENMELCAHIVDVAMIRHLARFCRFLPTMPGWKQELSERWIDKFLEAALSDDE